MAKKTITDKGTRRRSSTGSELGSYHWFHTLISKHQHMGEFLKEKTPAEAILRKWGESLQDTSKELVDGFELINKELIDGLEANNKELRKKLDNAVKELDKMNVMILKHIESK